MKIVIAHKYFYPRDGSTTHVFDLMELLIAHGHTVIPFAMNHPKNIPSPYAEFFVSEKNFSSPKNLLEKIKLFGTMIYSLEAKRTFKKLIAREGPDIVHIHNIYHHISPSILDVCKAMHIPVVQTVHDYKLICPNYKLFANNKIDEGCLRGNYFHDAFNRSIQGSILSGIASAFEMMIHRVLGSYLNRVNHWIVPSKCVAEKLIQGGYPQDAITVLNHFVSPNKGSEILQKNPRTLVCAGRLSTEKGFDVAIRAMRYLKDASLLIIGDGPAKESLQALAKKEGVAERVTFAGFLGREEVQHAMASAILTLVPSLWLEPFGYVILESLSVGTLVIGSDVGAISEILQPISDKLLVPPGDPVALATRVREFLDDSVMMGSLVAKGKEYARSHFDKEKYYTELIALYTRLL